MKFHGSKSDSLAGALRNASVRTRSRNYWGKKNRVRDQQPKPADEKHEAGQALFMQRLQFEEQK
jgi:hypothetical protein